jgi:hypothetical protein
MIFPSDTNVGNPAQIIYHACCCQGLSRAAVLLSSPHHLCQHTKAGGPMRLLAAAGPSWISFNGSHTAVQDMMHVCAGGEVVQVGGSCVEGPNAAISDPGVWGE